LGEQRLFYIEKGKILVMEKTDCTNKRSPSCLFWDALWRVLSIAIALTLTLQFILPRAAFGADLQFYDLAGLGQFSKPVRSVREERFKNLVEQKYDFSCGAAAVTTVLKYAYHLDVTELDVIEGMLKVSDPEVVAEKGFSLLDIRKYVQQHALRGRGYNVEHEALDSIRIPTITLLNIKGYQHFVVLKRTIGNNVYIADPALGNRVIPREEFLQSWNGVIFAVIGKGFDKQTVLSQSQSPLTARGLMESFSPISNSELLDFGFSHADLF
jgi:predicted double-glycine peptidase